MNESAYSCRFPRKFSRTKRKKSLINQLFFRPGGVAAPVAYYLQLCPQIFLATKFGLVVNDKGGIESRSTPEHVKQACTSSLNRLGVDQIDLYYCHRVDDKTPIEKTVGAMAELKKEGKIKYLGLSEVSAETLRRAHAVHPITCVQMEYSPFAMDIENPQIALLKTCRELGVATVAYSPLGRGFLTGAYKSRADFEEGDFRKHAPRYSDENFPKNLELVKHLQELAKKKGCTSGQLSLSWLLAQGDDIFPIPYVMGSKMSILVMATDWILGAPKRSNIWKRTLVH